jgi:DNA-3-methyladenine glycosylase II
MAFAAQHIRDARNHLRKNDQRMREVIQQVGPFTLKLKRDRFSALASSIVSQQISVKAARSIWQRLEESLGGQVTASGLALKNADQLRGCGISNQKAGYLLDLAQHVDTGKLSLSQLGRKDDESVIDDLIQVKGIGRWTAQMFLMFSLGRLDVLPVDDLGIKTAVMNRYSLKSLPDRETLELVADPWRPYATVACWYLWRSLEAARSGSD